MEKISQKVNDTAEQETKKIAELFTLLIQIDQKQKGKKADKNDRHN